MFYTFRQNNSGGYFIQNEDVDLYLIVEGCSEEDIEIRAEKIVEGYSEYCECCGERWDTDIFDELDEEPMIRDVSVYKYDAKYTNEKAIIYYLNGTKDIVDLSIKAKEKIIDERGKNSFHIEINGDLDQMFFIYGNEKYLIPKGIDFKQVIDRGMAKIDGVEALDFEVFKGINLIYKDIESDLISENTNSKEAYRLALKFKDYVDDLKK